MKNSKAPTTLRLYKKKGKRITHETPPSGEFLHIWFNIIFSKTLCIMLNIFMGKMTDIVHGCRVTTYAY